MNRIKKNFCLIGMMRVIFFLLLCASCHQKEQTKNKLIWRQLTKLVTEAELKNKEYLLIIPGAGCQGCINEAVYSIKENADNPIIQRGIIVFTEIIDFKTFRNRVGDQFLAMDNIILDKDNVIFLSETESIYPMIYKIRNDDIIKSEQYESFFQILDFVQH